MGSQLQKYHYLLAEYFHSKDFFVESIEEQRARAKRLPPTSRPVNIRKVVELPFHRLKAQQWDKIEELFSNLFFLESKTEGGMVFDLSADFAQVIESLPQTRTSHRHISLLGKALLREINFISRHPTMMFQCIWNICWWEAEESKYYYVKQQLFALIRTKHCDRLKVLVFRGGLHQLMERWAAKKEFVQPGFYWIRSHRPPMTPLGTSTGSIFVGHLAQVIVVCYSPDGLRIASGSNDNSIRLWDAVTGRELAIYIAKNPFMESIGFSPDGLFVACRFDSGEVRMWDTRNGAELAVLVGNESEEEWNSRISSIDRSGTSECSLASPKISFTIDNQRLISRSLGGFEEVWDPQNGPKPISKKWSEDEISYLDISADGRYGIRLLKKGGFFYKIILYDIFDKIQLKTIDTIYPIQIRLNQFVRLYQKKIGKQPFAKFKVVSSLQYFLFENTKDFLNLFFSNPPLILGATFSPDSLRFACWSNDCIIRIWDTRSGVKLTEFHHHRRKIPNKNLIQKGENPLAFNVKPEWDWPNISGAAFSPDGSHVVSWSDDCILRVWNSLSGKEQAILSGHLDKVNSVSWSPDGRSVISASSDRTIRVWQIKGGKLPPQKSTHKNSIDGLVFSPDGQQLLSWSKDNTLRLWDTSSGKENKELFGHHRGITDTNWCLDNRHLVSGDYDGDVCVWNAAKSRPLALFCGDENLRYLEEYVDIPCPVFYSDDGTRIISGSHASVMVWNVDAKSLERISYVVKNRDWTLMEREGRLFEMIGHKDAVLSVCMSSDKKFIVSSSKDKTVRVWDGEKGTSMHVLRGHKSAVNCVSFSPDGNRIASGSDDKNIRIWDSLSGNEICVLTGHSEAIHNVEWSRDGHFLGSSSKIEQYTRLWDIDKKKCIKVINGIGDLHAIVTCSMLFPYRALELQSDSNIETLIEDSVTEKPITWFSVPLSHLSAHPSGLTWAGADGKDVFIITLERGSITNSFRKESVYQRVTIPNLWKNIKCLANQCRKILVTIIGIYILSYKKIILKWHGIIPFTLLFGMYFLLFSQGIPKSQKGIIISIVFMSPFLFLSLITIFVYIGIITFDKCSECGQVSVPFWRGKRMYCPDCTHKKRL